MAEGRNTVAIIPLNGQNYGTWKVQAKLALLRDGLWGIVQGTEVAPGEAAALAKFNVRRDKALAIVGLSIDPTLLYLLDGIDDPGAAWKKLHDQYCKKTWANKLELRKKLHALRLNEGGSVQDHIRQMTELFGSLAEMDAPLTEEDKVVYLLASLPDSFGVLVTALEASPDVPTLDVVTERLLHQERKLNERVGAADEKALSVKGKSFKKKVTCFHCGKLGHHKRYCWKLAAEKRAEPQKENKDGKHKANFMAELGDSAVDDEVLVVGHAVVVGPSGSWIVDSGATSHMCTAKEWFSDYEVLQRPGQVSVGDGRVLKVVGRGKVRLVMRLLGDKVKRCVLHDVLHVPDLSCNLVSVSKASERGKVTEFNESGCQLKKPDGTVVAVAVRCGSLYFLDCQPLEQANVAGSNEDLWHRRYGHLGYDGLRQLAVEQLVDGFKFDGQKKISFCEACTEGKHHKSPFPVCGSTRAEDVLDLVHTDVCGKLSPRSKGGAEYFVTFVDDKSRYVWLYVLKSKSEVFSKFRDWKAMVERSTGRKLKVLRSDNGGEYTSVEFDQYLKSEGIRHQLTVPKCPQQNGVSERLNRTLVEMTRSMLAGSSLPQNFWAETLSTAVYLRNRSPTKAVKGMTPFEAFHGRKPDVGHLRAFGCVCYAHIAKDERKKLDAVARRCVLVGYGSEVKGYRLYDPDRKKVFFSRDVRFNESEVGFKESDVVEPVELEVDDSSHTADGADVDGHEVADQQDGTQLVPRRSERVRHRPNYYAEGAHIAASGMEEPTSYQEAIANPNKSKWEEAMQAEMKSLESNHVWELVELPKDRKVIGSKWVYKVKMDGDGHVERYKARLVAQGFSQRRGDDYDETFSPVVRMESLRTVVGLAVRNGLSLHQLDVTTAFLNGKLEEVVYMRQPEGFVAEGNEHLVCRLKRSIYGLKQSSRCWNSTIDSYLKQMGFLQSNSDPCVYIAAVGEMAVVGVYVDDIVVACKSEVRMKEFKQSLCRKFDVKDLGKLHHFLGMKVVQDEVSGDVWIGQSAYVDKVLERFGMQDAKSVITPVDTGTKLVKAVEDDEMFDRTVYQSAVGSLLYLSTGTRPDIAFAVGNVARFSANPTKRHWAGVKRIMRYLKGTSDLGLYYSNSADEDLVGYSDSDWASDVDDRRSVSGYMFKLCGAPISWRSKKQTSVALSTAEAEYVALSIATQEAVWLKQLLSELRIEQSEPTVVYEDNQSAISMTQNPQFHGRTKHVDMRYHFVREKVMDGTIEVKYCRTDRMLADILTKGLSGTAFKTLREMAGVVSIPPSFSV